MTLKAGDVVKLKSGGPLMTIDRISSSGESSCCIWFSDHMLYSGTFFNTALNIHKETIKPPNTPYFHPNYPEDDR